MSRKGAAWSTCIAFVLAITCVVSGLALGYRGDRTPMPEPTQPEIWIPEGAEIRFPSEVHPGTFYVVLGLDEFQRRFPNSGLVSVPTSEPEGKYVEVWQEHVGSAPFYLLRQEVKRPTAWSPPNAYIGSLGFDGKMVLAYPANAFHWWARWSYYAAVFAGLASLLFGVEYAGHMWEARRPKPAQTG